MLGQQPLVKMHSRRLNRRFSGSFSQCRTDPFRIGAVTPVGGLRMDRGRIHEMRFDVSGQIR